MTSCVRRPLLSTLSPYTTLFRSEEVWRGLTGGRSVHLTDWPDPGSAEDASAAALVADDELVAAMDAVREVVSTTLDRKSTRLNSSHVAISYAVFYLKKTTPHA